MEQCFKIYAREIGYHTTLMDKYTTVRVAPPAEGGTNNWKNKQPLTLDQINVSTGVVVSRWSMLMELVLKHVRCRYSSGIPHRARCSFYRNGKYYQCGAIDRIMKGMDVWIIPTNQTVFPETIYLQ